MRNNPHGEYLMHFERSAIIYGWQEDMVMFLAAVKPDRRKLKLVVGNV